MVDSRAQSKVPLGSGASIPPEDLVEIARVVGAHGVRGWIKIQPFSPDSTVLDVVKRWWVRDGARPLDEIQAASLGNVPGGADGAQRPSLSSSDSRSFRRVEVAWARVHGASWLASIKGLADRDDAHALKGSSIWVSRGDFPELDADEFYWVDLIGCEVYSLDIDTQVDDLDVGSESTRHQPEQNQSNVQMADFPKSLSSKSGPSKPVLSMSVSSEPEPSDTWLRLGVVESVVDNPAHPLLSVLRQCQDESGLWVSQVNVKDKPVHCLIPFVVAHVPVVDIVNRRILVDWPSDF